MNVQTFHQVAVAWKHLAHPNIVPLLGATIVPLQLVSDWMCGGDLTEYITKNPDADRPSLVRVPPTVMYGAFTPSPAIRCRRRPQLPPLLQCNPWRSQGSTRLPLISFHHHIDTQPAKRPCGRGRLRADHRLWSRHGHSKPGFDPECFR